MLSSCFLEAHKPVGRERHFGHTTVFWAWVAQILAANASCTKAVSFVQAWCRTHKLPVPSSDTSAYCQARGGFSESFLEQIDDRVEQTLSQRIRARDRWRGHLGIVNLSHGGVTGFEACKGARHDARIAPCLLKHIDEGDLVPGDRAFSSYEFITRIITKRKGHVLMRLHQARHRKLDWRKGKKISPIE